MQGAETVEQWFAIDLSLEVYFVEDGQQGNHVVVFDELLKRVDHFVIADWDVLLFRGVVLGMFGLLWLLGDEGVFLLIRLDFAGRLEVDGAEAILNDLLELALEFQLMRHSTIITFDKRPRLPLTLASKPFTSHN